MEPENANPDDRAVESRPVTDRYVELHHGLGPVLIVEDDLSSAEVLRHLLDGLRLANPIVHIDRGDRAVEWLDDAAQSSIRPALILLDVALPGRDGMDVLRWVRRQEHLGGVPVVVLTATAERADMDEAYGDLAVDSYLVKPVAFGALSDILRQLPVRWALLSPVDHG